MVKKGEIPHEFPEFNEAVRSAWDTNADYWNRRMGEGNAFHNSLVRPTQERLLALRPGEEVLDVACGNGHFARQMADLGANVTGIDFAPRQIANAIEGSSDYGDRVNFLVADATDESALAELGAKRFDAISCGMALMDMAEIAPFATASRRLLKPNGRLVFTVMHPAFNSPNGLVRVAERLEQEDGRIVETLAVKVSHYIRPAAYRGVAMVGQPSLQHYFHRPISVLVNAFFDAGFVADRIEEPVFDASPTEDALDWDNYTEIPPVLGVRLRLHHRPR